MPWNEDGSRKKTAYTKTSGFKMKGFSGFKSGIAGVKAEQDLKKELQLTDRWEGQNLKEFDRDLKQARLDFINSEPKPTPEEIKQFDITHAANREKALGTK